VPAMERATIETAIGRALLDQWDPLHVREQPGTHEEYTRYASDLYSLLARGASDVQLARHLNRIARDDLGQPDLPAMDLSAVIKTLRALEKSF
jgi:hypothetical protein